MILMSRDTKTHFKNNVTDVFRYLKIFLKYYLSYLKMKILFKRFLCIPNCT